MSAVVRLDALPPAVQIAVRALVAAGATAGPITTTPPVAGPASVKPPVDQGPSPLIDSEDTRRSR